MARAIRSNTRFDLIILGTCIVLAFAARALPETMREPMATGMRRSFLAPLVMLQESAERGRQSLLQAEPKQAHLDSLSLTFIHHTEYLRALNYITCIKRGQE